MAFVGSLSVVTRCTFAGKAVAVRRPRGTNGGVTMMAKSEAIPFLEAPKSLDGSLAGDVGFDPLYLTDNLNVHYMRSAELKNGRVAMLAVVGFVVQELVRLPGEPFASAKRPIEGIYKVPTAGWIQIIAFISICELTTLRKTFNFDNPPGDFGFDPLGLGKSRDRRSLELSEVKHGRIAMVAFIAFVLQYFATGQGVIEQLVNFKPIQ